MSAPTCQHCGIEFLRGSSKQKHCSYACRFLEVAAQFQPGDECWEWPKTINPVTGYGHMTARVAGKTVLFTAHRLSYELLGGGIPDELQVLHRCDNRRCFNPRHLFVGTQKDNIHDMMEKGRSPDRSATAERGDRHWAKRMPERIPRGSALTQAKLTEADVAIIRAATTGYGTGVRLAERYGISQSAISSIRKGKCWKHVP